MLNPEQAGQLRDAGLTAYNHNLDTSPEYYGKITTTRKYEVRSDGAHAQEGPGGEEGRAARAWWARSSGARAEVRGAGALAAEGRGQ
jgi:hypothetical protein